MSTSDSYLSDNETPFGSKVSSYIDVREADGAFKEDFHRASMLIFLFDTCASLVTAATFIVPNWVVTITSNILNSMIKEYRLLNEELVN